MVQLLSRKGRGKVGGQWGKDAAWIVKIDSGLVDTGAAAKAFGMGG